MKNLVKAVLIVITSSITLVSCSDAVQKNEVETEKSAPAQEVINTGEESKKVVEHHLKSFGENNLTEIMTDYTEKSIFITPDGTFKGLTEIEAFFKGLLPAFPTEGTTFTMDKMVIEDELAYIIWHAETPAVNVPMGSDSFIITEGKIMTQTFAGVINPVE